ncbi:MAG: site-specific integrase [Acetobacterium woodii]|nr:site-specific integrase [Acetobacterium woodii]
MARKTYKKKTKNGTEYYFFRLFYKDNRPKDIYANSVSEMEEKIVKAKKEMDGDLSTDTQPFGEFVKYWLYQVHLVDKKPSTKESYDNKFRKYIEHSSVSKVQLKKLTPKKIQDWYNDLFKSGVSTSVINGVNKIVRPAIRFAAETSRIPNDFSKIIKIPEDRTIIKTPTPTVRPLTIKEQTAFEIAIKDDDYEMLYLTAMYTGLRPGELSALIWEDIDFKGKTIRVNKAYKVSKDIDLDKYIGVTGPPKTKNANRLVPIPDGILTKLKQYQISQREKFLKYGVAVEDDFLVFSNSIGTYLDRQNMNKRIKKIYESCGIKNKRFYDLRHTYATRLFELGEAPKTVQMLMGHADISETLNTYTTVLEKQKVLSSKKLDKFYKGQIKGQNKMDKNKKPSERA